MVLLLLILHAKTALHFQNKLFELLNIILQNGRHPATVTRALKKQNSDIELQTARSLYSDRSGIKLGSYYYLGKTKYLDETLYESMQEIGVCLL